MKKRVTAIMGTALACAMTAGLLAGCGQGQGTESSGGGGNSTAPSASSSQESVAAPDTDTETVTLPLAESRTFTMFAAANGEYELPDVLGFQELEAETNIHWEVQSVNTADLTEKKGLLLASGNYPDVLFKADLTQAEITKYGSQGVLLPLNDYIEKYAPNLKAALDKWDAWDRITAADGNIYALPQLDSSTPGGQSYWINQQWIDNLGLKEPASLDELYNVLKAFKEKDANGNGDDGDEIPFSCAPAIMPEHLLPYFGITYDASSRFALIDGELVYAPKSDTYKEFVAYVEKLYEEGLLDKNSFTQTLDQFISIAQSGDIVGSFFGPGAFPFVGRERDPEYHILTPFEEGVVPVNPGITTGTFAITDKCENPEIIMAWVDRLYTQEGGILAWMGVEDKSYEMNDDGTWKWMLGEYGDDIGAVRGKAAFMGSAFGPFVQPELWFKGIDDKEEARLNQERSRVAEMGVEFPALSFDEAQAKTIATYKADLDKYVDTYLAEVATGIKDLDSTWQEYVTTLEAMGAKEIEAIYQEKYQAAK